MPNNFDFIRLVAALLVIIGHAFVFVGRPEPLVLSMTPLGGMGVYIFFTISGYLVTQSWDRHPHWARFLAHRLLRIVPGLTVAVLSCVLVLGPLFTQRPLGEYFRDPATRGYLSNIYLYVTYYLPGVFEHNRVPYSVNGSLWSLPVEFCMYLGTLLLGLLGAGWRTFVLVALLSAMMAFSWAWRSEMWVFYRFDLRQLFICGTYFWFGALFQKFDLARRLSLWHVAAACALLLALQPWPVWLGLASWLLVPVIVLGLALDFSPWLAKFTARGDYSFGLYIYAFPVQQALSELFPTMGLTAFVGCSTTVALALAMLSWHLVEKPMLGLKRTSMAVAQP